MKKIFKHRTLRSILFFFLTIFTTMTIFTSVVSYEGIKKEKELYITNIETDTQHIIDYVNQSFTSVINTCNGIFASRWYNHYRNNAQIYKQDFHMLKRMEIITDIRSKVTSLPFVSDILIITMSPNSIISKDGWTSIDEYLKIYNKVNIEVPDNAGAPHISHNEQSSVCTIVLDDPTPRRDAGMICVLVDKTLFAATIKNVLLNNAVYVHAMLEGQTLYQKGEKNEQLIIKNQSFNIPNFSLEIGYTNYSDTYMARARVLLYLLTEFFLLIISLIVSIIITFHSFKPLIQLVKRYGGGKQSLKDPYQFISEYIDSYSRRNDQLKKEKESLNSSVERFTTLLNKELLFSMMTNPEFDFDDENIVPSILYLNKEHPFILILLESRLQSNNETEYSVFDVIAKYGNDCYKFDIFPNNFCLMIWFQDMTSAQSIYSKIQQQVKELSEGMFYYAVSNIIHNPENMSSAYLSLRNELTKQKHEHFDMPISVEITLINALQKNKTADIVDILSDAKTHYDPNAFLRLLLRIAAEYNIDSPDTVKQYLKFSIDYSIDKQWELIIQFAQDISNSINSFKNTNMDKSMDMICQYINEHYCNPDLSINQLADYMSIHRTTISKMIKTQLGITFSDYILELRIKKAMQLLKESDNSMNQISKDIGYENYNTFKRAFVRYLGISPREYREQCN